VYPYPPKIWTTSSVTSARTSLQKTFAIAHSME